jgi:dTDP-4-dehydrorhamnose 3,5-epimerase
MIIEKTPLEGLVVIAPEVFEDERGYFFESYNLDRFRREGLDSVFVQDNESRSRKGVLRGLHFQRAPFAQGKLVRVILGAVLDVAVDIRPGSSTFGKWHSVILSEENKLMYWIPAGLAHGFLTLEDHTVFSYKCTQVYHRESEGCIRWNDPELGIDWGPDEPLVSARDRQAPLLREVFPL